MTRNVTIEYRWATNQIDRLPALAADLLQHRVAVIVTPGPASTFAAMAATSTVPIVFVTGIDPVRLGLVASLNRPGGNVTGYSVFRLETEAKRLEVLHELLPATASVGYLQDPRTPTAELATRELLKAADAIGVKIQMLHAATEGEIDSAFASLAQARTGGYSSLMIVSSTTRSLNSSHSRRGTQFRRHTVYASSLWLADS